MINCYLCGKKIVGSYLCDWAGHTVCASHHLVEKCVSCGQICDNSAINVGMGSKLCNHCKKYRIEKSDSITIIRYLKGFYASTPIGTVVGWRLIMINPDALFWKTKDKNIRGLAEAKGSDYTIYIYRELSRVVFAKTLAHEMLHIYQYQQGFNPEKVLREGFCNLGSFLIMKDIGNKEAMAAASNMMQDPDPIYGEGLRRIKAIYDEEGWDGTIKAISNRTIK